MGSPDTVGSGGAPILVTGVPRSGTTWLARLLAAAPNTSMPGREPMNPRGRQFALGGQLKSWVRRDEFSAAEASILRRCYAGREPRTFSRYGIRQWAAPLTATRVVIKDPFALLSTRAIHDETGAIPVVVYRHPAAVLASYRRMGWSADVDELCAIGAPSPAGPGDLEAMAAMWAWCHQVAVDDLSAGSGALVVSHHDLTVGGEGAHRVLFDRLGLPYPTAAGSDGATTAATERRDGVLHDFGRSSDAVETGWRSHISAAEIARLEEATAFVREKLEAVRLHLPASHGQKDELS